MNETRVISTDSDELSRQFADWMANHMAMTLERQDDFSIALSGGSTPKKLFRLLATEKYRDLIDWGRLHFFWGDERYVPFHDERNNARMAFTELLEHVPANRTQIHVMRTDLPPEESAIAYEQLLQDHFDGKPHTFDLVMLGLGDNAHTLSLFPGYPIVREEKKWVSAFFLKEQDTYRISLTAPVVNRSAVVAYLVSGADKAVAVQEVIEGARNPDLYPAQVIHPDDGALIWFLDEAAAGRLSEEGGSSSSVRRET